MTFFQALKLEQKCYLQFIIKILMAKRKIWSPQEDKIMSSLLCSSKIEKQNFKWTQIQDQLKKVNPGWTRTGRQCRQRWINHIKPLLQQTEETQQIVLQQFFQIIRVNGKKWSLIAKEFSGQTQASIKNFFYSSLRKGLRNLNLFNFQYRNPKIYRPYKYDLIHKLLSINDEKKSKDLRIVEQSAYTLAHDLTQGLIKCSKQQLKSLAPLPPDLQQFYETLNQSIMYLSKICKFKKFKKIVQDQKIYKNLANKINKNEVINCLDHDQQDNFDENIGQNEENCPVISQIQAINGQDFGRQPNQTKYKLKYNQNLYEIQSLSPEKNQPKFQVSHENIQGYSHLNAHLFDILSMPVARNQDINLFY